MQVPLYAATVARARLQRLLDRLTAALRGTPRNPENPAGGSAWPGARGLLLLKLWATLFPASDRRHAVLTPAALIVGACLAMCPLACASDVAQGAGLACMTVLLTNGVRAVGVCHALRPLSRASDFARCARPKVVNSCHSPSLNKAY